LILLHHRVYPESTTNEPGQARKPAWFFLFPCDLNFSGGAATLSPAPPRECPSKHTLLADDERLIGNVARLPPAVPAPSARRPSSRPPLDLGGLRLSVCLFGTTHWLTAWTGRCGKETLPESRVGRAQAIAPHQVRDVRMEGNHVVRVHHRIRDAGDQADSQRDSHGV
jgi:hypothetical protein